MSSFFRALALSFIWYSAAVAQSEVPTAVVRLNGDSAAPTTGTPTLSITAINIAANSLEWDPANQKIYLSLPSWDGANGNAVQALDPATGQLGANVFVGSEPDLLSLSTTSKYLYVGLDGASMVQRLTLPDLGKDIQIPLVSYFNSNEGPLFASDLQSSPMVDGTVAVVRSVPAALSSPIELGGVVIYDNGVARTNVLCGFIQSGCQPDGKLYDSIQWNANATVMFAADNETIGVKGFDFYTIPVTSAGFGEITDYRGLLHGFGIQYFGNLIHFDRVTGYVYDDGGAVIDPVAGVLVGTFNASGIMVPDGSLGKAFFIWQNFYTGVYTMASFDIQSFAPIATATLSNLLGAPTHLIRWGADGLAFTTTGNALYILSGSFVGSGGSAPSIANGGIAPVGSYVNTVRPGEWISIYGSNFATKATTWNGDFPISLGGVSITIDGEDAYLSYVSPGQINLQVPDDATTGPVSVAVTTPVGTATSTVTLASVAPSLPLLDNKHVAAIIPRSNGSGAFENGTYDVVGPTGTSLGYPTVAAKAGDLVELFAFGLGPTNPNEPAGQPYSGAAPTIHPVTLSINGSSITPSFAGLSSAGLYQVNFTVPAGLGSGDLPIQLLVSGAQTPSGDVITLQ